MDGVIEINHARALAGGITAGDAPDYPITIDEPGSYRLTGNLTGVVNTNGIVIDADDVTLDLNGFSLVSGGGSVGDGILVLGEQQNLTVRNGTVKDWGDEGIDANDARNSRFEKLRVSDNQADGILVGRQNAIVEVEARNNGVDGIDGDFGTLILNSTAAGNGDNGIESNTGSTIIGSTAYQNVENGIATSSGCTVTDSSAADNGRFGFNIGNGGTVMGNSASQNAQGGFFLQAAVMAVENAARLNGCTQGEPTILCNCGFGIKASTDSFLLNNQVDQNNQSGICTDTSDLRIDGNHATDNGRYGIEATGSGSLIIRNSASGNSLGDYSIAGGNIAGPILLGTATTTQPFANFDF